MATIHFLNVNNGDCSIIEHNTGRNTVIDVCNAKPDTLETQIEARLDKTFAKAEKGVNGNFNQKAYPVNPILYMKDHNIVDIHRFILTHPDMDHLDGIQSLFAATPPTNFWDTDNNCEKDWENGDNGGYSEDDWTFYTSLRDGNLTEDLKRLTLFSGATGKYWNRNDEGQSADGIQILAPTKELLKEANKCGDHNDCSYVILYRVGKHRILFGGDSHDKTWEHILTNHEADVKDVDVLVAPHHGRDSGRSYDFLDIVNPILTLFGNAKAQHLAYAAWNTRNLKKITNNQGGCILLEIGDDIGVFVTCEAFAKASNPYTFTSAAHVGYHYYDTLTGRAQGAVA